MVVKSSKLKPLAVSPVADAARKPEEQLILDVQLKGIGFPLAR